MSRPTPLPKQELRDLIRKKSLEIGIEQRALFSEQLAQHLMSFVESQQDLTEIVGFKSFRDEIDLAPFASELSRRGIRYRALTESDVLTHAPQLMIVPGVAFDSRGNRLGRGKGYYDRMLKPLRESNHNFVTIGVLYDHQLLGAVPTEEHDERVDFICTPSQGLLCVKPNQD